MFKNGFAVVARESAIPAGKTEFIMPGAPQAAYGTFWVMADPGVKIKSLISTTRIKRSTRDAASLDEILTANKGKRAKIYYLNVSEQVSRVGELLATSGQLLVLRHSSGTLAIPKSRITMVESEDGDLAYKIPTESKERVVRVELAGPARGKVKTVALQRGMTWVPAYAVDITDKDKLTLTAKATIVNELTDMENAVAKLVTGFPHIAFLNQIDPFVSPQNLRQMVDQMAGYGGRAEMESRRSALTQNMAMPGASADAAFEPFVPAGDGGFGAEDLFFYQIPGVSLKKEDRGYYVLFQMESDYRQVYKANLTEGTINAMGQPGGSNFLPDVWHTLKFTNTSKQPLTTAAATTMSQGEIIGQDLLKYLAPNAQGELRVNKSLDIRVSGESEIVDRRIGEIKDRNDRPLYDVVVVRGKVTVHNQKAKDVQMEIGLTLTGDVTLVGQGGTERALPVNLNQINPTSVIKWEPELESGKKVELTYTYEAKTPTRR